MSAVIARGNDNHCLAAAFEAQGEVNFGEVFEKYGIVLLMQETSEDELADLDGELPTDTYCVRYRTPEGGCGMRCSAFLHCK